MTRFIAACLLILAGAVPAAAQISTPWSAVQALRPGTPVLIQFPNGQRASGLIDRVTDEDIAIRERAKVAVLHRRDIVSVSIREPAGQNNHAGVRNGALIGAAVGVALAVLAAWHQENGRNGIAVPLLLGATGAGAAMGSGSAPKEAYRDRVIYMRE